MALRVLIVDDDRDTTDTLADAFTDHGCEVRVAANGRAAIEQVEAFRPRLVVLDIGLPDCDGFDVAQQMRARSDLSQSWLVALTGFHDPRTRRLANDAGFNDYLVKPIDAMSLEALVREASSATSGE
ncbi:MAG TPA: response regulator [Polyangiaceae bacterium]|nr:response regulator [Polyangiaceae bacterium]